MTPHDSEHTFHRASLALHESKDLPDLASRTLNAARLLFPEAEVQLEFPAPERKYEPNPYRDSHSLKQWLPASGQGQLALHLRFPNRPDSRTTLRHASFLSHLQLVIKKLDDSSGVRRSEVVSKTPGLSPRERETLSCLVDGKSNEEIARILGISPRTVEKHVGAILQKTSLDNRKQVIAANRFPQNQNG